MESHYDTLGLSRAASPDEIKLAYRRLAQKLHPDKNRTDPVRSAELFTRVRQAYEALISPDSRREHADALERHETFQTELARRRDAYARARAEAARGGTGSRGAGEGNGAGSYRSTGYDAKGYPGGGSAQTAATDWHARAWELVQRARGEDNLARALRAEGCLPSLATPLARDVAREYEQLKANQAQFQANVDPNAEAARRAYRAAQARASASAGTGPASAGPSASRAAPHAAAQSKRASGGTRKTQGPFVFETRRANASSGRTGQPNGNRFGWIVVAVMLLLLFWHFSPSTRTPIARVLSDAPSDEGAVDTLQPRRWLDPRVAQATGGANGGINGGINGRINGGTNGGLDPAGHDSAFATGYRREEWRQCAKQRQQRRAAREQRRRSITVIGPFTLHSNKPGCVVLQ
jgi:curved DNA-binding protein CbpA